VQPVFAEPPDPCFGNNDCPGNQCRGGVAEGFMECCWDAPSGDRLICQFCAVTEDGELLCDNPKVIKGTIAPPPSGVAPPPPTESCPENTARDVNGNCTPLTQTPETPVPKGGSRGLLPDSTVIAPPPSGVALPPPPGPFCPPFCTPVCPKCVPPIRTTDTGTSEEAESPIPPPTGPLGETAPQAAPLTAEDGSGQPPNQPLCPEGQVLDEETDVCVPIECPEGQVLDEDTNLCFRVSQEQEEQQQQSEVTEEEQPVPICQEGLEFNEDLGFCVPTECPEGQELDEQAGICVLEEPEVADVPEQSEPEQPEQQSSEGDGSQDNGNNDDN
jgi:hypothetical protein